MVLNPSGITNVDTSSGSRHNSSMLQKAVPLRRRRSKGTIAGFASSTSSSVQNDPTSHEILHNDLPSMPTSSFGGDSISCSGDGTNQPQHANDGSQTSGPPRPPPKPCHSARLALLCVQNAAHMGARTQLNLCPPGKARDDLLKALQMKRRKKKSIPPPIRRTLSIGRSPSFSSVGSRIEDNPTPTFDKIMGESGLNEYDQAEDDYLNNPMLHSHDLNSDGEEMQEESSSGDEDSLDVRYDDEDGGNSPNGADGEDEEQYHGDKLYSLGHDMPGGQTASSSNKLAFNMRKLKWFDSVTASERATARQYLRKEFANLRKKDISLLTKHLKKMQRREKRRVEIERGRRNSSDSKTLDTLSDDDDEELLEQSTQALGLSKLPGNMTPSLSAALVLESLAITPLESLEGMSKCYEGIVAAGSALLDANDGNAVSGDRIKPSKSEIMSALAPLLITTLEQAAGETILGLAKLRKLCGTKRYQRRFVQRIAPSLVRPPNAAMWCLRHRDEMESILAATEMILDASFEVFASGWYERGRTLLADSKRAETLKAAAMQLKRLSTHKYSDRLTKGLSSGLHRRGASSLFLGSTTTKDAFTAGTGGKSEVLAEWEVLAVDRQIRKSIENLFTMDWSRVHLSNVPPRDGESYPNQRTKSRGITGNRPKPAPSEHLQVDTGTTASDLSSPTRQGSSKKMLPVSPGVVTISGGVMSGDGEFDSMFGNPFSANSPTLVVQDVNNAHESKMSDPLSPPNTPKLQDSSVVSTPPRSPPHSNGVGQSGLISPPRQKLGLVTPPLNETPTSGNIECGRPGLAPAPLSPSNTSRKDSSHQRFSTNPTLPGSQNTYLRTLTSTAAERKRTVAACRALRAQIARFEDAFIHLHGRAPKGATERAPLATTYAQYREWKRAIRADAASRIQALSRGARTRSLLMENIDPRFKEIVTKRAGRPGRKSVQDLQHLAIPTNITGTAATSGRSKPLPMNNSGRRDSNDAYYGVEVFYQEPSNGAPNRPASDWNSSRDSSSPSTRTSSRDDDFSWSVSTSGPQHHYSSRNDSMSTSSQPSYINMTFAELQTRKRELKQQLKQYDMNFFNQHGRMPVKVEKEPIRHLYENYNSLKNRISATAHEREGPPITPIIPTTRPTPPPVTHNYAETNGNVDNFLPIASTSSSEKTGKWKGSRNSAGTVTTAGSSSGGNPINLAGLKTEKQTLHQMLRSYEKDFFNLHSRQVSCYADIRPVASQYRRYKEIKKQISALQETGAVQK